MIIDTSAVMAILLDEAEARDLAADIEAAADVRMSAASVVEASLVCGAARQDDLDEFLRVSGAVIVPVDEDQVAIAREAHLRFGRGSGSPAKLNYGDCFSYALARQRGERLLFAGDDFTHNDLEA